MRKLIVVLCFALAVVAAPTAAFGVSVSSSDGTGNQEPQQFFGNGADLLGSLRSFNGDPVYYSGRVDISLATDQTVGRYTTNTTSTVPTARGGTVSFFPIFPPNEFQGVRARICKDVSLLPDPCGSWSTRMAP